MSLSPGLILRSLLVTPILKKAAALAVVVVWPSYIVANCIWHVCLCQISPGLSALLQSAPPHPLPFYRPPKPNPAFVPQSHDLLTTLCSTSTNVTLGDVNPHADTFFCDLASTIPNSAAGIPMRMRKNDEISPGDSVFSAVGWGGFHGLETLPRHKILAQLFDEMSRRVTNQTKTSWLLHIKLTFFSLALSLSYFADLQRCKIIVELWKIWTRASCFYTK